MTESRVFDVNVVNRNFRWRCIGAVWEDGTIDLVEVNYLGNGYSARVREDNLVMMRMDELLMKKIREELKNEKAR